MTTPTTYIRKPDAKLLTHADVESKRYALGGLSVNYNTDGTADIVATDGRRLIVAHRNGGLPTDEPVSVIVDASTIKETTKQLKHNTKTKDRALLTPTEVITKSTTTKAEIIDGLFPTWQGIVAHSIVDSAGKTVITGTNSKAADRTCAIARVDARYLADAALAVLAAVETEDADDKSLWLCVPTGNPRTEHQVELYRTNEDGSETARAVVMPLATNR